MSPDADKHSEAVVNPEIISAREFVESNKISLGEITGLACIDGRATPFQLTSENRSILKRPGGALGWVMLLVAMGWEVERAVDRVAEFLAMKDIVFSFHTDDHAHPQAEDRFDAQVEFTNLHGAHMESMILVIDGQGAANWSVLPNLGPDQAQAFIYDKRLDTILLEEFVAWNNRTGGDCPQINPTQLLNLRDQQDMATLGLLGSSINKPIIQVNFKKDGAFSLKHLGKVQPVEEKAKVVPDADKLVACGCGHCRMGMEQAFLYGLRPEQAATIYQYALGKFGIIL